MSCNCARLLARSLKCGYFLAESATGAQERVSAVLVLVLVLDSVQCADW